MKSEIGVDDVRAFVYLSMLSAFSVSEWTGVSWTVNNGLFFFFLKRRSEANAVS